MSAPEYKITINDGVRMKPYYIIINKKKKKSCICSNKKEVGAYIGRHKQTVYNWLMQAKQEGHPGYYEDLDWIISENPVYRRSQSGW